MTPPAASPIWTDWRPLALRHRFTQIGLQETLEGGQSFRWRTIDEPASWQGVFSRHAVQVRLRDDGRLEFRSATEPHAAGRALANYLGMAPELDALLDRLPHRSDTVLASALAECPGLILLRQPFGEALLSFICSSTKRIVQIAQLCENLAAALGDELAPGIHALPTWERLATVGEGRLRGCGLGFRARHVHETALLLATRPGWLERIPALAHAEARAALMELPGVGEKVAECVLLFGAGKLEAFPVDVWITRTLAARYGLEGWRPVQLAQFGRAHFGPLAGLAQQYLFAAARASTRTASGQLRDSGCA